MKVGIIGGGGAVGSTCAFNVARDGIADEVVLVDVAEGVARGHAIDIEHAVALENDTAVTVGNYGDLAGASAVVIAVGTPTSELDEGGGRDALLGANLPVLRSVFDELDGAVDCPTLTITNPVDVLLSVLAGEVDRPREHLLGYNLNDTMRLRWAIADYVDAPITEVEAYVLGEHGPDQVPAFSCATVGGKPVAFDDDERREIAERARESAWAITESRGESARWATGRGLAVLVDAICRDLDRVLPCSFPLEGEYGHAGMCLGVPTRIGRDGVTGVVELDLDADERGRLADAADKVEAAAREWAAE